LASVNLLLMIFNLIPIGPLDGHYILPYFLPRPLARFYRTYNHRYGTLILLGLIIAIVAGLPIQGALAEFNQTLLRLITLV
jgi:Zn-dependent protease